jgi:hypothetical protein
LELRHFSAEFQFLALDVNHLRVVRIAIRCFVLQEKRNGPRLRGLEFFHRNAFQALKPIRIFHLENQFFFIVVASGIFE